METVLVVEDEPALRRLISQLLQLAGYTVLEAGSGAEALHLAEGYGRPADLLLTDVVMPAMSGPVLAERLLERTPGLRVLFTSGYIDHPAVKEIISRGAQFLPKPFLPAGLTRKVRELLDRPCAVFQDALDPVILWTNGDPQI